MTLCGGLAAIVLAAFSLVVHPAQVLAQWAVDGAPVCADRDSIQRSPAMAADGAGGAIVSWADLRSGRDSDIYTQRITASGRVAAGWPRNGVPATRAVGYQLDPALVSDDVGGAIIAWWGNGGVRAQRITGAGRVAAGWPADGIPLSDSNDAGSVLAIVSDGEGGAVVLWVAYRNVPDAGIYGQRVTAAGAVAPGWPASAVLLANVTSQPGLDSRPHACTDGSGGALVTWLDGRDDPRGDVYAQHVTGGGIIATGWNVDGVGVAVAWDPIYRFSTPAIAPDGAGGAIIAWYDSRDALPPVFRPGVRALRISGAGSLVDGWPPEGIHVGGPQGLDGYPTIAPDGHGGAFIAWLNEASRSPDGIYVQHVNHDGRVPTSWPNAGLPLSIQSMPQEHPVIVADGSGGGIVTWVDYRNGTVAPETNPDVYAQRFTAEGKIVPGWPANGVALCRAPSDQFQLTICSDEARGAIVAWEDHRLGNAGDIYAARVLEKGWVPPVVPVMVKPGGSMHTLNPRSEGIVLVAVLGTESFDARSVSVSSVTVDGAPVSPRRGADPSESARDVNHDGLPDLLMRFPVDAMSLSSSDSVLTLEGETLDGLPVEGWGPVRIERHALRAGVLAQRESDAGSPPSLEDRFAPVKAWPSPSFGRLTASFSLPAASPATLELLDVSGRRILARDVGSLGPGTHVLDLSPGRGLVPGIYLLRLTQGQHAQSAKVIIAK